MLYYIFMFILTIVLASLSIGLVVNLLFHLIVVVNFLDTNWLKLKNKIIGS